MRNYLRPIDNAYYTTTGFVDSNVNFRKFSDGQRRNLTDSSMLRDVNPIHNTRYHRTEFEVREILADCLVKNKGSWK